MLALVRTAEISGRMRARLHQLPECVVRRADSGSSDSGASLAAAAAALERQLDLRMPPVARAEQIDVALLKALVTKVGVLLDCEPAQEQRLTFVACGGDVLLVRMLHVLVRVLDGEVERTDAELSQGALVDPPHTDAGAWERRRHIRGVINEALQILAELAIADVSFAQAIATHRPLLALLFRLLTDKRLVDAALTLAQELLAVGPAVFPLASIPGLPDLLGSLSPRSLALAGRALAVLLARAAEATLAEGLPEPECVPPELCASCANNQLLLETPKLLERIVLLLRIAPPVGLWGHMFPGLWGHMLPLHLLSQLPEALGMGEPPELGGDADWARLNTTPQNQLDAPNTTPSVHLLLSPDQVSLVN